MKVGLLTPKNYQDALNLLSQHKSKAKIVAGGTDILVKHRKEGLKDVEYLIDISTIRDLRYIRVDEEYVAIGSASTFTDIIESPIIQRFFPGLAEAAMTVGSVQIQNRATIGGNICNASAAADSVPMLMALKAQCLLESIEGERIISIEEFIIDKAKVNLRVDEMLREIRVGIPIRYEGNSFEKLGRRKALAISLITCGVSVKLEDDIIKDIRIYTGCLGPKAIREREVENLLISSNLDSGIIDRGKDVLGDNVCRRLEGRWSGDYKSKAVKSLYYNGITRAIERAKVHQQRGPRNDGNYSL